MAAVVVEGILAPADLAGNLKATGTATNIRVE